jgi:hypothetical protein
LRPREELPVTADAVPDRAAVTHEMMTRMLRDELMGRATAIPDPGEVDEMADAFERSIDPYEPDAVKRDKKRLNYWRDLVRRERGIKD